MRWFKKDLRFLAGCVETYVLKYDMYVHLSKKEEFKAFVRDNLEKIVLEESQEFEAMLREREVDYRKTSQHFEKNPEIYGDSTPEMIKRFSDLADQAQKDADRVKGLRLRIESEGLPDLSEFYHSHFHFFEG